MMILGTYPRILYYLFISSVPSIIEDLALFSVNETFELSEGINIEDKERGFSVLLDQLRDGDHGAEIIHELSEFILVGFVESNLVVVGKGADGSLFHVNLVFISENVVNAHVDVGVYVEHFVLSCVNDEKLTLDQMLIEVEELTKGVVRINQL